MAQARPDGNPLAGEREAARGLALSVLQRVRQGAYLAPTLSRALDGSGLEGQDRALVTDLSYGTVRRLPWLEAALAPRLRAPHDLPDDVMGALLLGSYEILVRGTPRWAAVDSWVEVMKAKRPALTGLTNAVLRRIEAPASDDEATAYALPAWLWRRLVDALGRDAAGRAAAGMLEPEPLWLTGYGATLAQLEGEGIQAAEGPFADTFAVRTPGPLGATQAYRDGLVQPQNPSSTVAARLLAPAAGERVLDLASGSGIKTAQLAAMGAAVTAVEIDPRKVQAARRNLARLGLQAEHHTLDLLRRGDLTTDLDAAPAVLLDAPCSGTGTLRGHPEIKLRLREEHLPELASKQDSLLDAAASLVAPGGRLVYAVCALTALEGEERTAAFLQRHAGFRANPDPSPDRWPIPSVATPNGWYLLPVNGFDGFYLGLLQRSND